MHCIGRDIRTIADGGIAQILAEDRVRVCAEQRTIASISSSPPRSGLAALIGARAGGHLRATLDAALPTEREDGTPLYLLVDDLAGATLVSPWAWSHWRDARLECNDDNASELSTRKMENVCFGLRTGSSAFEKRPNTNEGAKYVAAGLPRAEDPAGWHALAQQVGVAFRRARRIDVWREGDRVIVDSFFQDSATAPDGCRFALHEYRIRAASDHNGVLTAVVASPGALPFLECPGAASTSEMVTGTHLSDLRRAVLDRFKGPAGCTHLNDALRALAEVPKLAAVI